MELRKKIREFTLIFFVMLTTNTFLLIANQSEDKQEKKINEEPKQTSTNVEEKKGDKFVTTFRSLRGDVGRVHSGGDVPQAKSSDNNGHQLAEKKGTSSKNSRTIDLNSNKAAKKIEERKSKREATGVRNIIELTKNKLMPSDTREVWEAQEAFRNKEFKKSQDMFSELIKKSPKQSSLWVGRSMSHIALGEMKKGKDDLSKAISLDNRNTSLYLKRAKLYLRLDELDKGLADVKIANRLEPKSSRIFFLKGEINSNLLHRKQAILDYTEAIRLDPEYVEAYRKRGRLRAFMGNQIDAIVDLENAIVKTQSQKTPSKKELALDYVYRAYSYQILGKNKLALEDYHTATKWAPDLKDIYSGRAIVYRRLGEWEKALSDYNTALELDPTWTVGYYNRANIYLDRGEKQKAFYDLKRAVDLSTSSIAEGVGNKAVHLLTRGRAYRNMKQEENTMQDFQEAYSIFEKEGDEAMKKKVATEIKLLKNQMSQSN